MIVLMMVVYHIAAMQLLYIAVQAWRWNGMATRGSGRLLGPFALAISALAFRLDVYYICRLLFGFDLRTEWWWHPITLLQAIVIAATGMRLCIHLHRQIRISKQVIADFHD